MEGGCLSYEKERMAAYCWDISCLPVGAVELIVAGGGSNKFL